MNKTARLLVVWLTVFIDLLGFSIIIPILPDLAVSMGEPLTRILPVENLDTDKVALAVAALYPLMNFLFAPFWGSLSDRLGRRPVILFSIGVTAVSQFWFAFISAFWMLALQRCLAGIGSANISAANAYIADISTKETRAKNMGLIGAAFGMGFIIGPVIGGFLYESYGLFGVGMASGGLSLINLIFGYFYLHESLQEKNTETKGSMNPIKPLLKAMNHRAVRGIFLLNL
ncbi:MAG: MFS transporter, partial [Bacteroidota bacterium]|nr:MFS transporter [Bacteroidota bacterium]MDX5431216.1 MFS transporter [Bacteroidota bacterium]MDX5469955.1 MFS transporter [Bacteroidota bacterium]